ncbi:MAG: hypothetical protein OEY59_00705 [Deltaproteobacteria bacterium]|nr:hypothetical protein [Deltaproteobacteria bacterium]
MKKIILFSTLIIVAFVACGRKTSPSPYNSDQVISKTLPPVENSKVSYKNKDIKVTFELPKSFLIQQQKIAPQAYQKSMGKTSQLFSYGKDSEKQLKIISFVQLNFYKPQSGCLLCEPLLVESVRFDLKTGTPRINSSDFSNPEYLTKIQFEAINKWKYKITLPNKLFLLNWEQMGYFMQVNYLTNREEISFPSENLIPVRPAPLPKPKVFVKQVDPQDPLLEKAFIFLKWNLVLETTQVVIEENGNLFSEPLYYKLNLYQIKNDGKETQLNKNPLVKGTFLIKRPADTIYATFMDRFDNESEKVFIFQE